MPTTYTEHKLTDSMLQRLSKLCKGKPAGGISLRALQARELIEERPLIDGSPPGSTRYVPTQAGRSALYNARREGW